MNVLFICSQNLYRSPTAEAVFSGIPGLEVSSAGTNAGAETPISADLIEWADTIFVMETAHRRRLQSRFGSQLKTKRLIILDIPDLYEYMDPALVSLLKQRVTPHLKLNPTQAAALT